MKINEIIKLSDSFATEVNVLRDYSYKNPKGNQEKIKGYLPNKSSREIIKDILLTCPEGTDKKLHLVTASYGTGKSYMLLMLANLLANNDKPALESFVEKIHDKEPYYKDKLSATLDNHINNSGPFLIVIPEYGDTEFNHALLEGLKYALQKNNIDYIPKTNYETAIAAIGHWRENNQQLYNQLKEAIVNNTTEHFIEQLRAYNPGTYQEFKTIFQNINGVPFPETHTSAYPVFADTAKEIRKRGYRGIAIIYDEFGEMLGKLINNSTSSTGIAVQDFLENVKDKTENSNILFIAASHQDPMTLRASKEKELNKIIGRFMKHQMIVSEAEGEEIMGTIFIKSNQDQFDQLYKNSLFHEHLEQIQHFTLYPNKDTSWLETKILKNLYPLHPLTTYILPRLSAEYAQNTRSMFNFLSPIETKEGVLRYYLESTETLSDDKVNLFTPDLLLDFFLKNIREDKEGRVQSLYEVYRMQEGKVDGPRKQIMKILFMFWVVNTAKIRQTRETIFWAMNWGESRKREFNNLLDDLVAAEYLDFIHADKTYQFPNFGSAPLSKIIEEEKNKLRELSLTQCLKTWADIVPVEHQSLRDHNTQFGCNRDLYVVATDDSSEILSLLLDLDNFYHYKEEYFGNGYLFYLVASSEDGLYELKQTILKHQKLLPYVFYAVPNNLPQFDNLKAQTLNYRAIAATAARPDIMQHAAHSKSIQDQLATAQSKLEEKIKDLYEPTNWKWSYETEEDTEISSKPKLGKWLNSKIDILFSDTPTIKDEALWYTEGGRGKRDRKQALDTLFNADKDRIPLRDDNTNATDKRILKNFFSNISLTTDQKRDKNIQYGEIKTPDQSSQIYKAWKHIDKSFSADSFINPLDIISPLLKAPYGYSDHIISFLLTAYIRYHAEKIIIADAKRKSPQVLSADLLDKLMESPGEYVIRKIEISGPESRYLNQLKTLFKEQIVNTWNDIAQKFIGVSQYLTPLHKGIIRNSGDNKLIAFFESLEVLKQELNSTGTDKDRISQDFLQETLPSIFLHEDAKFMEDSSKITLLITKLSECKKYPLEQESAKKLEVIKALAKDVFDSQIANKSEITKIVLTWYKSLPTPNQSGKYTNKRVKEWITEIALPIINDPFELYLEKLNEKPFKDWEDFSYEKYQYISRFKEYKNIIEEYTKNPLEVFQTIAREVFQKSAAECETEEQFDLFFKDWWGQLPVINKAEQYTSQSNFLISQISLPADVKARYLVMIPQVWRQKSFLPEYIAQDWEDWSYDDTKEVAKKYKECIKEINAWKPPIEEHQLTSHLGGLFNIDQIQSLDKLYLVLKAWFDMLPERTKNARWASIDTTASLFISSLTQETTFNSFIMEKSTSLWGLPEFKKWDEKVVDAYIAAFASLKEKIQRYRRPLNELVAKLESAAKEKSVYEETYCLKLSAIIKETEAYKNKVQPEFLLNEISIILFELVHKNKLTLTNCIALMATKLNIKEDWHFWSDEEDKIFASDFKKGIQDLVKWKIPEEEKIKKAKPRVKTEISVLQKELDLTETQMRKVLNDILEDKK